MRIAGRRKPLPNLLLQRHQRRIQTLQVSRVRNKAGYTAQDAPTTRQKGVSDGRTDGLTDGRTDKVDLRETSFLKSNHAPEPILNKDKYVFQNNYL